MREAECWDVLSVEVREVLTLLFSWRLAEFFKSINCQETRLGKHRGSFSPVVPYGVCPQPCSLSWPFSLTLSYCLSSSVLRVLFLVVPWVLECISCTDTSVALLPDWGCSAAPLPNCYQGAHPFSPHPVTGLGNLFHYSIIPSPFLLHCGILEMTLNIRIICNLLSPRGQLRRWGHTSHQLCPTEVKMPGDVLDISGHFSLHFSST